MVIQREGNIFNVAENLAKPSLLLHACPYMHLFHYCPHDHLENTVVAAMKIFLLVVKFIQDNLQVCPRGLALFEELKHVG